MAKLEWDHTVHYVNQLENAIKTFQSNSLHAFQGGSHKEWGTCNTLSYFDLCYIEFLSIEDQELAESITDPNDVVKDAVTLLPDREILSRVALRTDDIQAIANQLDANGIEHAPIIDGKRMDGQGNLIEWFMMTIPGNYQGLAYPFVIQWKANDQQRRQQLQDSGALNQHPIGEITISQAIFEVDNPKQVAAHWHDIFGINFMDTTTDESKLVLGDKTFLFKRGSINQLKELVFVSQDSKRVERTFTIGEGNYRITT
ncbi:VOC family protein [Paraliobacillus ryukyuensis]|uniref:VOC family protein n=1 Tax=Paraliobacillus ryukyuensis TaxID=200904 RepID=UPI0009A7D5C5|nr:VOC family protein [Paraliobacillus ryukyuensis]